jgi:hypothetical protein
MYFSILSVPPSTARMSCEEDTRSCRFLDNNCADFFAIVYNILELSSKYPISSFEALDFIEIDLAGLLLCFVSGRMIDAS